MDTITNIKRSHIGHKIERVRKLRGLTQDEIASGLGISKQAISKIEQSENIEEERLQEIANVLGVTLEGLKNFREESVLYNTNNFFDKNTFSNSLVSAYTENINVNNPLEKIIELYENLLKVEREKVEILQGKTNN